VIYIYSPFHSERLTFVLDFCFKSKGLDYSVINSISELSQSKGTLINYSNEAIPDIYKITSEGLLFDNKVNSLSELKYECETWFINEVNDVFSVVFYMLSSFEEYIIQEKDEHLRFSAKHSFLQNNGRLHKPNADILVKQLWEVLGLDYSKIESNFNTHLTFDIDSAWAIKNKGVFRSIASDVKDLLKGKSIKEKFKVRFGKIQDPFDTYSIIKKAAEKHPASCFFLLGDWGKFDKNIHWKNTNLKQLTLDLKKSGSIGIHPSYASYLNETKVKSELNRLNTLINTKSTKSRQHFLKLDIPHSYQLLESIGITDDYSMGFADGYGFRSGTCFSYPFFDLTINSITKLTIHPITYMDGTLNQYLGLSVKESIAIIQSLKAEVKNVGGTFCPLWHNETIGEVGIWKGWRKVFESNF
jgi:hypothetical protein